MWIKKRGMWDHFGGALTLKSDDGGVGRVVDHGTYMCAAGTCRAGCGYLQLGKRLAQVPPTADARTVECSLFLFLSDPSPIIGYACHSLTNSLTHSLTDLLTPV